MQRKTSQTFKMSKFDFADIKFPQLGSLIELKKHPLERYSYANIIFKSFQTLLAPSKWNKVFSSKQKKPTFDN